MAHGTLGNAHWRCGNHCPSRSPVDVTDSDDNRPARTRPARSRKRHLDWSGGMPPVRPPRVRNIDVQSVEVPNIARCNGQVVGFGSAAISASPRSRTRPESCSRARKRAAHSAAGGPHRQDSVLVPRDDSGQRLPKTVMTFTRRQEPQTELQLMDHQGGEPQPVPAGKERDDSRVGPVLRQLGHPRWCPEEIRSLRRSIGERNLSPGSPCPRGYRGSRHEERCPPTTGREAHAVPNRHARHAPAPRQRTSWSQCAAGLLPRTAAEFRTAAPWHRPRSRRDGG